MMYSHFLIIWLALAGTPLGYRKTASKSLTSDDTGGADEAKQHGVHKITVATLNALVKSKMSRSLASFPTVTDDAIRIKKHKWLAKVLDIIAFKQYGIDVIAVQESDDDVKYSKFFDCTVTWVSPPPLGTGDKQHLCLNKATIEKKRCEVQGESGTMSCELSLKANATKTITVMAAHATPSFSQISSKMPSNLPDIILMDANEKGSAALAALNTLSPGRYSRVPEEDGVITAIKSAFKYRKLYQAFEGTCAHPRKCQAGEEGFADLPDELSTCEKLRESKRCGEMDSQSTQQINPGQKDKDVCKYASRVCGTWEEKNTEEMDLFTETHPGVTRDKFDLKNIQKTLWGSGPTTADTDVKKAQEDIVIFKNEYELLDQVVYPGTSTKAFMDKGKKFGFPNIIWPSDHFLVAAALKI